jgi:hypothetical protein
MTLSLLLVENWELLPGSILACPDVQDELWVLTDEIPAHGFTATGGIGTAILELQ